MADNKVTPERVKNVLSSFLSGISKFEFQSSTDRTRPSYETSEVEKATSTSTLGKEDSQTAKAKPEARDRTLFFSRVETYSPLTWFAKPLDLSPLMCARYGWENIDTDMLRCVSCRACLSGQLPKAVDTQVYRESYLKLKTNIEAGHEKLCTWLSNPSPESFMFVPYHNREELLNVVQRCLQTLVEVQNSLPTVTHKSFIEQLETEENLQCLCENIQPQLEAAVETEASLSQNTCLLALTGWTYSAETISILHCNYCRRRIGLWNYKHPVETNGTDKDQNAEYKNQNGTESGQSDDECGEPSPKRIRIEKQNFDPVAEHRYWCPWVQTESLCLKSKMPQTEGELSTSPHSTPLKSTPLNNTQPLPSTPTANDSAKDTELKKVPAWLVVLKTLSGKETFDSSSHIFQTKTKRSPQLEDVRYVRQVLRDCTSPKRSANT